MSNKIDLMKWRSGEMVGGGAMTYTTNDSMALPATLTTIKDGVVEVTRYDSRWYALAVFAQETDNKDLLTQVQAEEPCDCGECPECGMEA